LFLTSFLFAFNCDEIRAIDQSLQGARMSDFMRGVATLGGCIGLFTAVVAVVEMLAN
jgi:hypothetical protein